MSQLNNACLPVGSVELKLRKILLYVYFNFGKAVIEFEGESFASLSFAYRISPQSVGLIVPEVCSALSDALRSYIKVRAYYS